PNGLRYSPENFSFWHPLLVFWPITFHTSENAILLKLFLCFYVAIFRLDIELPIRSGCVSSLQLIWWCLPTALQDLKNKTNQYERHSYLYVRQTLRLPEAP